MIDHLMNKISEPSQSVSATDSFVMSALHLQPAAQRSDVSSLSVATAALLEPYGLDERQLTSALGTVMGSAVDYADLYFQSSREESWALEDGIVKEGAHSIEQGVGVRALSGE